MTVDIVRAANPLALRDKVNALSGDGWRPEGTPFEDHARNEWCWAVIHEQKPVAPGGIKLREPVRSMR